MKFGVVSDIHCNAGGLLQALEAMGEIDALLCLGDSIWEYRFSNEVVGLLKERDAIAILGNHEEGFFSEEGVRARSADWIDPALLSWLAALPLRRELSIAGKKLLLVHSTPWEPRGAYVFPHSALLERFAESGADFVLYGHTHAPLLRRIGKTLVLNPGSAGEPRNGWQLSCAVLDSASGEARLLDFPDPST